MKPHEPVKFDYAQSNWRQSIAVKIASQITWILVPIAFISSLFAFHELDRYILQNFEYKVDSLTYRVTSFLFNNPSLTDDEKYQVIQKIGKELNFKAVKVISSDYKQIPSIDVGNLDSSSRTTQLAYDEFFDNELIVVTGYHEPISNLIKQTRKHVLVVTILCLTILATFLVFSIRQKIYNPLKTLVEATEAATNGEKNIVLDTSRKDEFGHLSIFFEQMLFRLNEQHNKLKETAEEAKNASSAKSVFLANMSHELRTPLNAIIGYGELILDDPNTPVSDVHYKDLRKIVSAGHHLLHLINEILDLSKIEAGKLEVIPVDIDLPHMFNELSTTIEPLVEKNNNKLIVDCSPQVRQIYSDNMKVRQILINLLGNACKFTRNGIISLKAEPRSINSVEHVSFSVADTGTGIEQDLIDTLFEPFTQGDLSSTKSHGGTGLGLSICHRLSILLGGEITVTSTLDEGSTFSVTIPVEYTRGQKEIADSADLHNQVKMNQRK